jgi:predicted anti-sigma-YlaC factor YlaD
MRKKDVACRDLVELVTDYIEGTLPRRVRAGVDRHLESCPGCRTVLAQMRETIRMTGTLTEEQIPDDHKESLLTVFRGWRSRR